jgi:5-oxoprolinase (ATP-hydrolysing)
VQEVLTSPLPPPPTKAFEANYFREFGFTLTGRSIHVDDVRVRATGKGHAATRPRVDKAAPGEQPTPADMESVFFEVCYHSGFL